MTHETNGLPNLTDFSVSGPESFPNNNSTVISKSEFDLEQIQELNRRFENSHPDEILSWGVEKFGRKVVLGTGFGPSGVFLIHRLVTKKFPIKIFYLDTHLLFSETYQLRDELEDTFDISIERVSTQLSVEDQANKYGDELWKSNPDKCCYLRKVLPLKNYLADKEAWVTGVRRSQSVTREQTQIIEWDPLNEVIKINPLARWGNEEVWEYINSHELPYNPLHDYGYPTIGCIPCTEAVETDSDERSGRWKKMEKTECGIHLPSQNYRNGKH
jgi:phosphoadenosine phosphosulfate reductase